MKVFFVPYFVFQALAGKTFNFSSLHRPHNLFTTNHFFIAIGRIFLCQSYGTGLCLSAGLTGLVFVVLPTLRGWAFHNCQPYGAGLFNMWQSYGTPLILQGILFQRLMIQNYCGKELDKMSVSRRSDDHDHFRTIV
jgi:hypothetical protein